MMTIRNFESALGRKIFLDTAERESQGRQVGNVCAAAPDLSARVPRGERVL